jgi:hypothetical protein
VEARRNLRRVHLDRNPTRSSVLVGKKTEGAGVFRGGHPPPRLRVKSVSKPAPRVNEKPADPFGFLIVLARGDD